MQRKIVLSFLTLSILFIQLLGGSFQIGSNKLIVYAAVCSTEAECAAKIDEAKKEIADLEEQESAVQEKISDVESDIATTLSEITEIEETIASIKKNITSVQNAIVQKEAEISENEATLNALDIRIDELKDLVANRMRLTQRMSRNNTMLEVLTESNSLVDFVRRVRVVNYLTQGDAEVMDELKDLVAQQQEILQTLIVQQGELKTQKDELSVQKANQEQQALVLETYQQKLEKQQEQLANQLQEVQSAMMSAEEVLDIAREQQELLAKAPPVETKSSNTSNNNDNGSADKKQNSESSGEAETNTPGSNDDSESDTPGSNNDSNAGTSGSNTMFIIPLETGYVSCEFMCYTNHTGIDLANYGNTSTRILAAATGVVVRAGWHSSYGNHVIITHNIDGQTYTTLYAHMVDTPQVSTGQTVSQGQVLGRMGSTGNSSGPHLHFEIYEGIYNYPHATNPRRYISFPASW